MAQHAAIADVLEACARALHSSAFDFREPARSTQFAEDRIDRVEQALAKARRAVRGG